MKWIWSLRGWYFMHLSLHYFTTKTVLKTLQGDLLLSYIIRGAHVHSTYHAKDIVMKVIYIYNHHWKKQDSQYRIIRPSRSPKTPSENRVNIQQKSNIQWKKDLCTQLFQILYFKHQLSHEIQHLMEHIWINDKPFTIWSFCYMTAM